MSRDIIFSIRYVINVYTKFITRFYEPKNMCNLIYDKLSKQSRNVCERALLIVVTQCLMPHERFITHCRSRSNIIWDVLKNCNLYALKCTAIALSKRSGFHNSF